MQIVNMTLQTSLLSAPIIFLSLKNDSDRQFVTDIYFQYRRLMYVIAREYFGNNPADIEDVIETALERMCKYIEKIRAVDRNKMKSYVVSLTGNVCREQIMKHNARDAHMDHWVSQECIDNIPDPIDPFTSVFDHSDAVSLLNSFNGLNDREKDLIRLRHIDQREFSEMAEMLNMSEGAVRTALARAKKHLRKLAELRKSDLL